MIPKPDFEKRCLALIAAGSFLSFVEELRRLNAERPWDMALSATDGSPATGGAVLLAVRRLSEAEFAKIVNRGLPQDLEFREARRFEAQAPQLDDAAALIERPVVERLLRRPDREVAFHRKVRQGHGYRCAMSGLMLRNCGGRPGVQAAHIRPVEHQRGASWRNGLALSGRLRWMFDRGLISLADDCATILVSHKKVALEVVGRLLAPERRLLRPLDPDVLPHRENLRWHLKNVFGRALADGEIGWWALLPR